MQPWWGIGQFEVFPICIGTIALSGPELRKSKQTYCTCCTFTVNEFWVTVQRTEASERCGLLGNYWLKADGESLILKEPKTKKNLLVWPYKLLRRYGRDRVSSYFIIFNRIWREIKLPYNSLTTFHCIIYIYTRSCIEMFIDALDMWQHTNGVHLKYFCGCSRPVFLVTATLLLKQELEAAVVSISASCHNHRN